MTYVAVAACSCRVCVVLRAEVASLAPVQLPLFPESSPWYVPGVPLNPATGLSVDRRV